MSEDWKVGFHRAVIDSILAKGRQLAPRSQRDNFGWRQDRYSHEPVDPVMHRILRHGIDYNKSTYVDSNWSEFAGTFTSDEQKYGMDAEIVTVRGERFEWRYEGTLGQMLDAILERDGRERD